MFFGGPVTHPSWSALLSSPVPRWVLWVRLILPMLGLTASVFFILWTWNPLLAGSLLGFIRRQGGTDTSLILLCILLEESADPTSSISVSAWLFYYPNCAMETRGRLAHPRNGFLKTLLVTL